MTGRICPLCDAPLRPKAKFCGKSCRQRAFRGATASWRVGTIYFVQQESGGPIKIGWTAVDLRERLVHLQNGNPDRLVLLASYAGTRQDEGDLHRRFRDCRRPRGEWFEPTAPLLEYLAKIGSSARRWRPRSNGGGR